MFNAVQTSIILHEELRYFYNRSDTSESFIDHDTTSQSRYFDIYDSQSQMALP